MKKSLVCIAALLMCTTAIMATNTTLQVSSNGRYLTESGNAFFPQNDWVNQMPWMADTTDISTYMDARIAQGFNVISIQAVFDCDDDAAYATKTNIVGLLPFATNSAYYGRWDVTQPVEGYWTTIDTIIDTAAAKGLYVALAPLPTYGLLLNSHHTMDRGNDADCYTFGNWVGARYATKSNIIWLAGLGAPQNNYFNITSQINALAQGIADGVNGVSGNLGGSHDYTTTLMGYYTWRWTDTSANWFGNQDWLDFNSVVEVPGRDGTSYYQVPELESNYALTPAKPTWLMGPIYEDQRGTDFVAPQSRFQAYQSVLAGGFGISFGNQNVANFEAGWDTKLSTDAADDMQIATSVLAPMIATMTPDQSLIVGSTGGIYGLSGSSWYLNGSTIIQAARTSDGSNAVIYTAQGDDITVAMSNLTFGTNMKAEWLDPRTGVKTLISNSNQTGAGAPDKTFAAPGTPDQDNDQVLVLTYLVPEPSLILGGLLFILAFLRRK